MGFGALRSLIRPASRIIFSASPAKAFSATSRPELCRLFTPFRRDVPWIPPCSAFHSLSDTKYPKRRPSDKSRRKRASIRPRGPFAWVKYVPGEPIVPNQPNEGSVKKRNEKKRIKLHRAFIKEKTQSSDARGKKKKLMKRVERKMAAVARERAWAERLAELKRMEAEKRAAMA